MLVFSCLKKMQTELPDYRRRSSLAEDSKYTKDSMKIETLLTEAEISEEFAEAMEARDVPEKFFYWHPLCVKAWLALSRSVMYESRLHSWNLLVDDVENISGYLDSIVAVIRLRAGDGAPG